jgi:hypothetical protein
LRSKHVGFTAAAIFTDPTYDPRSPRFETTPAVSLAAHVLRATLDLGLAYSGLQVGIARVIHPRKWLEDLKWLYAIATESL